MRFSFAAMLQKVFEAKETVHEGVPLFARMGSARFSAVGTATRSLLRSLPLFVLWANPRQPQLATMTVRKVDGVG